MHWVLLANGHCQLAPRIQNLLSTADRLVAVDGGGSHLLAMGLTPHLAVGDMDSIPSELLELYRRQGVPLHLHPPQKDATDLELALHLAFAGQATRITLLGATGGRLDHTLGNLFLLSLCQAHSVPTCIMDAAQSVYLADSFLELQGTVGDTLSLMPVTPQAAGVTLSGLEYPLQNATLHFGTTWGMSNVFTSSTATVRLETGRLLVFHLHRD
ncbi:MAG: thiamine diphosphokinase [Desulfovibrionales bacterium]|nr:thiamine diphosphokinase [Desulfovibrionales bacterium]